METFNEINNFKHFLRENRKVLLEKSVKIEDLPEDDEWIQDNEWDEIYIKEVENNGKI